MKDLIGQALKDFYHNQDPQDLYTQTNISELDVLPTAYLFRSYDQMPLIEKTALDLCRGHVLDVGCGSGSHALFLQENGQSVTAIDQSPGAIEVAKLRGVRDAFCVDFLSYKHGTYDTILMLMNGTGLCETLQKIPVYLAHIKSLLNPKGTLLIDSRDLQYMYDQGPDGAIWVPADRYYGELDFKMSYKSMEGPSFPWLFVHPQLLESLAQEHGFDFKLVGSGDHYDYLAALTLI